MPKLKNRFIFRNFPDNIKQNNSGNTLSLLKNAWDDLPVDSTMNERSLFIEIAERLIKADPGEVN